MDRENKTVIIEARGFANSEKTGLNLDELFRYSEFYMDYYKAENFTIEVDCELPGFVGQVIRKIKDKFPKTYIHLKFTGKGASTIKKFDVIGKNFGVDIITISQTVYVKSLPELANPINWRMDIDK